MDRKYPNALAYITIEAVIRVKQKLWAVKIWAKMIWKQPSSFAKSPIYLHTGKRPVNAEIFRFFLFLYNQRTDHDKILHEKS